MNKSVKTNVAIFLAATMVTGLFAMISPSFIDVEASGDKRDYKHQDRHAKSNGVNVKFICNQNNIDVGGIGIDLPTRGIESALTEAQAQEEEGIQAQEEGNQELSANSMQNGERNQGERNQGFKQHDSKNIVFICNNNNDGGNVPPVDPESCDDCFLTIPQGGFLPPGQLDRIEDRLAELQPLDIGTIEELCEFIGRAEPGSISLDEIEEFIDLLVNNPNVIEDLAACLFEFVGELRPSIP